MRLHISLILSLSVLASVIQLHQSHAFEVNEQTVHRAESEAVLEIGHRDSAVFLHASIILLSPELQQQIQSIADEITEAAECDVKTRIYIIHDQNMNLLTFPNGDIFIFTGFLDKIDNLDELASGLGHEIAHLCLNHGHKRIKHEIDLQYKRDLVANLLASMVSSAVGAVTKIGMDGLDVGEIFQYTYDQHVTEVAGRIVSQLAVKVPLELVMQAMIAAMGSYSQKQEEEADHWGMVYIKKAGYDPAAAITTMEKMSDIRNTE